MKISPYQTPELRNESDAVIQVGTYGKYTPFANAENTGILDYINNNLEALKNALSGAYVYVANKASLPTSGDATKIYVTQDDGKSYKWTGTEWSLLTARLDGLSAYEVAQSLGFTGTEEEWIMSLGSDTVASATVDDEGYLVLHMKGGGEIRTPLQPIIDCIKYRDETTEQATNASNSATSASNSATASSVSEGNAKISETNAKVSETNAKSSEVASKNWAVSETSPDGATDTDSGTGKTQSSRTWALESKASANSASTSATNASTSASNASKSEVEAKTAQAKAEKARDDANSTLAKLTSVMMYTGQVDNYSDLDSITKSKGDVWNIVNADKEHGIKAGDNVVWNGASWDNLSGVVDLSAYAEKADYQKVITSATANGDTITFNHKDGTASTATVNNVSHAGKASQDDKGQTIDIADIKSLITTTVNDGIATALQKVFPVGSIYSSLTDSRNPADILGFGTWEALPAGYGLVAQGTATAEDGSTLTFTAGEKSGEFKHQLTVGELPKIEGTFGCSVPNYHSTFVNGVFSAMSFGDKSGVVAGASGSQGEVFGYHIEFGNNQYHNNVSPCISAYMFKRVD